MCHSAVASAMRKVVDALPETHRARLDDAAKRFLIEPETDLLSRRAVTENLADGVMNEVRAAVLTGHRLRFDYPAPGTTPSSRTVDPIGLVTVRNRTYLLATTSGQDRTCRLSRMNSAEALPDPAQRPAHVDLDRIWAQRSARFLSRDHIAVIIRVKPARREELLSTVRAVHAEEPRPDGWIHST